MFAFVDGYTGGSELIGSFQVGTDVLALRGYVGSGTMAGITNSQVIGGSTVLTLADNTSERAPSCELAPAGEDGAGLREAGEPVPRTCGGKVPVNSPHKAMISRRRMIVFCDRKNRRIERHSCNSSRSDSATAS